MTPMFKRASRWYVRVPHPDGGSFIRGTGSTDKAVARRIDRAMQFLKDRKRTVILLGIYHKDCSLDTATDAVEMGTLDALEAALNDIDVEPYVPRWYATLVARFGEPEGKGGDTPSRYLYQVRTLIPVGEPCPRSTLTTERLSAWLYGLPVAPGTRLIYKAAMGSFLAYLRAVGVVTGNPLNGIKTPEGPKRTRYLELADFRRLIDAQPYPFNVAAALVHLGAEAGAVPPIRVRDVDVRARTVRVPGTKTATRDRVMAVAAWAWGYIEQAMRGKLPDAYLIDRAPLAKRGRHEGGEPASAGTMYRRMYAAHRAACAALGIADYRQHDGRHSYAVRMLASGAPAELPAAQLGHSTTDEVTSRYGRFRPTPADQARWEAAADARDAEQTGGES
jgi:integrase